MASAREILKLIIRGDVQGLKKALDEGTRGVRAFGQKAIQSFRTTQIHVDNLRSALAALGVGLLLRTLVRARLQLDSVESSLRVATGSSTAAAREFGFVKQEADRLGLSLQETARDYSKLAAAARGTALEGQPTRDIFLGVMEASTALGLSAEQTSGALTAIEQIISKGKVSAEELRGQLGERLPGAFQLAARAIGVTTQQLDKMLADGDVLAEDLLPALGVELRRTFGAEAASRAGGLQAEINRLKTTVTEIATSQNIDGITRSIRELRETLQDPSVQSGLGSFIGGLVKLTEWSAKAATFIANLGKAIGFNFTEVGALTGEVNRLQANVDMLKKSAPDAPILPQLEKELAAAQARLDAIMERDRQMGIVFGEEPKSQQPVVETTPIPPPAPPRNLAREKELEENREADAELIASMKEQIRLAQLSEIERQQAIATSKLSKDATEQEAAEVRQLAADLHNLEEAQKKSNDQMKEFAKQAAHNIQNAFSDFFFDPFDDGLEGLVKGFANAIRQMLADALALQTLKALSNATGWSFLTLHTGGVVSGGGNSTADVSPLAFFNAQRYHSGGVLGLGPDEVPIIGKRGEEMLTQDDPRHRFNGGGVAQGGVRIVNLIDPSMVAAAMQSPEGEKAILNVIKKNPEATGRRK